MFLWPGFHSVRYILLRETKWRAGRVPVIKCRWPVSILIQIFKATRNCLLFYCFKATKKATWLRSINPESLFLLWKYCLLLFLEKSPTLFLLTTYFQSKIHVLTNFLMFISCFMTSLLLITSWGLDLVVKTENIFLKKYNMWDTIVSDQ